MHESERIEAAALRSLAAAIILTAGEDWKRVKRKKKCTTSLKLLGRMLGFTGMTAELREFFYSEWFCFLAQSVGGGIDPERIRSGFGVH